jgi:Rieske Fe-S protein
LGSAAIGVRTLWPRRGHTSVLRLDAGAPQSYGPGEVNDRLLDAHGVWVIRDATGFYALSSRCTHLGCKLRYLSAPYSHFHCMCHGSLFSIAGKVLRGPATRTLERVFLALSAEGRLLVDPHLHYRLEQGEWNQPGAHVRYLLKTTPPR